ncbi:plasma membrane fusion protein prm1 [Malassezia vespertilionis]|uniref:plasma membrane fusion protein prm1 n=1 Tax=Malassezia vespertilionis TaxID=2020962 RepID=UPI0024B17032|nr:plasma membrane fusion protein prm1 [Malassezia vespertilionis]WFD05590.1 plasma membrane fusion protein prm1 [Malassezia vespertilionis]
MDRAVSELAAIVLGVAWYTYHCITSKFAQQATLVRLVDDARAIVCAACRHGEDAVARLESLPAQIAWKQREAVLRDAEMLVRTMGRVLVAILSICSVVINMLCSSYRALFLCTLQLVIQSILSVLDAATKAVADGVQAAGHMLHAVLGAAFHAVQGAADLGADALNAVFGSLGVHIPAHAWTEPHALQLLDNITVPPNLVHPFASLRTALPSVDELRSSAEDAFDSTLRGIQAQINQSMVHFAMPAKAIPPVNSTSAMCDAVPWDMFRRATTVIRHASIMHAVLTGVLMLVLLLGSMAMAWRSIRTGASWLVHVVVFFFILHWILLEVHIYVLHKVDDVTAKAVHLVNETNAELAHAEQQVNTMVLGRVHEAIPGAFAVLDSVLDLLTDTVHNVFGATPIEQPAQQFAACLLGNKLHAAEKSLEVLQRATFVQLPRMEAPADWLALDRVLAPISLAWQAPWATLSGMVARELAQLHIERLVLLGTLLLTA